MSFIWLKQVKKSEKEDLILFCDKRDALFHAIQDENAKVLAIPWDQNRDELALDLCLFGHAAMKEIMKHIVTSTIARFFDLLGLVVPVIMP